MLEEEEEEKIKIKKITDFKMIKNLQKCYAYMCGMHISVCTDVKPDAGFSVIHFHRPHLSSTQINANIMVFTEAGNGTKPSPFNKQMLL